MKSRLAVGIATGLVAILIVVAKSQADPKLPNIPAHRHFVKAPNGELVEVGPRVCDNPNVQQAFNQFHVNVHATNGAAIGPAAPGLHNFTGADLMFSGC